MSAYSERNENLQNGLVMALFIYLYVISSQTMNMPITLFSLYLEITFILNFVV